MTRGHGLDRWQVIENIRDDLLAIWPVDEETPSGWWGVGDDCYPRSACLDKLIEMRRQRYFTDEDWNTTYHVVTNDDEEYAIWARGADAWLPDGWHALPVSGRAAQCQDYIDEHWVHWQPLSERRRQQAAQAAAPVPQQPVVQKIERPAVPQPDVQVVPVAPADPRCQAPDPLPPTRDAAQQHADPRAVVEAEAPPAQTPAASALAMPATLPPPSSESPMDETTRRQLIDEVTQAVTSRMAGPLAQLFNERTQALNAEVTRQHQQFDAAEARAMAQQRAHPMGRPAQGQIQDCFVGEIRLFAGPYAPAGWATCDGQWLRVAEHQMLFSLLYFRFGGDDKDWFALPDLRGRVPVHCGHDAGPSARQIGERVREEVVANGSASDNAPRVPGQLALNFIIALTGWYPVQP